MPEGMLSYAWYADNYQWPPWVVDELPAELKDWYPIVAQAKAETAKLKQAGEQGQQ